MKAIAYIRVSTEGQAAEGVSLEAQQAKIVAWCQGNGFELAGSFVDAGISGKTIDKRPGLQAAIAATCEHKAALVVYSLSRLARSTKDAIAISEQLHKAGADLVSLSERIDTTSAAGKMIFRMMAVMAEFERDLVSERTTAALQHKRSQGQRVGTVPYGFRVSRDGKTLEANPEEAKIADVIRQLRRDGMTLAAIREELADRGIANRAGNEWPLSVLHKLTKKEAA